MPEINMTKDHETKGTLRWAADDEDAPVTQVYVRKPFAETLGDHIVLSIETVETPKKKKK